MLNRWIQNEKLDEMLIGAGVGIIPFSILSQGLLTGKYNKEIPKDSRIGNPDVPFLNENNVTPELREKLNKLDKIAVKRNQSMAQMAIAWTTQQKGISTVLLGVSRLSQLENNLEALNNVEFSKEELTEINEIIK